MPFSIKSLFEGGAAKLVDSVGKVLDNVITTKDELEAAKLKANEEINRHLETLQKEADEMEKAYLADTQSARSREMEVVKSTGHFDYAMWVLAAIAISLLGYLLWTLTNSTVPQENREMLAEMKGTIEMIVVGIFSYYFGSSVGSRIKDMKAKQN